MSKKVRILSSILISTLCYFYFTVSSVLYLSSDNVMVAVVTNGLFSSNPFCQYLHPLLCLIIRGIALLIPTADAFTVLKDLLIFGELALVFYVITSPLTPPSDGNKKHDAQAGKGEARGIEHYLILAVAIMADVFLSMGINLWRANYTITAGSFAAMGISLLLAGKRYGHNKWSAAGCVYLAAAFMLRRECGLLALPFLGLHVAGDLLTASNRRTEARSISNSILPALIIVALLLSSQALFYSREPYAESRRYNDYRTICVDYPMQSWASTDFSDRSTYLAATDWTFIDTEHMNADTFEAVARAGSRNQFELNKLGLRSALWEMRRIAFRTDVYMAVGVVLALLMAAWNVIAGRGAWRRVEAVLAVAGAFTILFYFTIRGRAPLRVWQPVMFATITVEVLIYISSWKPSTANVLYMLVIAVLLYYSAGQVIAHAKLHAPVTAWTSRVGADDSEYRDDRLYIWPNWHATIPKFFAAQNKLPTKRALEHNIALGDWTYGQPFYNEFLARIGAANPAVELVEGRAYVMEGNKEIIESYLQQYYGEDIILVETGIVIDEREAYKVERRQSQ